MVWNGDGPVKESPLDPAKGDPSLRMRSSSSIGLTVFFLRQKRIANPPRMIAPPTPTNTPMTMLFCCLLRPLEGLALSAPATPVTMATDVEVDIEVIVAPSGAVLVKVTTTTLVVE